MNVGIMGCASIHVRILGDRSNVYVRKDTSLHQIVVLVMVSVFVSIVSSFLFIIMCCLFALCGSLRQGLKELLPVN